MRISLFITCFCLCATYVAHGQQVKQWLQTKNAAGLGSTVLPDSGQTWLGGNVIQGDFRRAQQAESSRQLLFFSDGFHALKKGMVYGSFQFTQQQDVNVQFSDVMDPYRGTPYLIADSVGGDWKKQMYNMQLSAASGPLLKERIRLGIGVKYKVATGARQNDPRPLNDVNELGVMPGLTWQISKKHTLGVNGFYGTYKESIQLENKNTGRSQYLYKLLGLGQYELPTIMSVSATRYYNGTKYGGDVQYHYQHHKLEAMLTAGYRDYKEVTTDGTTSPLKGGTFHETETNAGVDVVYGPHHVSVGYIQYDRIGTETQYSRNTATSQWDIVLEAPFWTSFVQQSNVSYEWNYKTWLLHAGAAYNTMENKYLLTNSIQQIDYITYSVTAGKSWNSFDLQLQGGYRQHVQDLLNYQLMTTTSNLIAYKVLYPDHAYMAANAYRAGLQAQYYFKIEKAPRTRFFVRGQAAVENGLGSNRTNFLLAAGAIY